MNTSKIMVRLDAEARTAELEVMVPHGSQEVRGLENAVYRIGMHPACRIEISTPRYRVTRLKVSELDGSPLGATRVMQLLRAAHHGEFAPRRHNRAA